MAASGVGAAIALASIAGELAGEIVFLGTPAEEYGSGKQFMIDDGLFDAIALSGTPAQVAARLRERNAFADRSTLMLYNETEPEAVTDVVRELAV